MQGKIRRFFLMTAVVALGAAMLNGTPVCSQTAIGPDAERTVRELLERECTNLNKEQLYGLITKQFSSELTQNVPDDLLKIMEGVVKRTDFDAVSEDKTAEIIGLVHGAYHKGAPLEFLDDIFDVAYVRTITVEQMTAAANALKEFHTSDVPQEIYEEFVYHSIEDGWDPAVMPVLARGLIYGVDRGLSPDKVALIIMLDKKNDGTKNKAPEQLVMDAVKLVREKEPGQWKPMTQVQREMAAKLDRQHLLEKQQVEVNDELQQKERAFVQAQRELKELREYPASQPADIDIDKVNRDLEKLIKRLQADIDQAQTRRTNIAAELETTRRAVQQQQAVRSRDRQQRRDREIAQSQQRVAARAQSGRLDRSRLESAVDALIGTPYRFGGDSDRGIDCSAFTRRVYRSQAVELPRNSREQAHVSASVQFSSLREGDLVFFDTSINGVISHVGVYMGNGVFAHASSSKGVTKSSIRERYYQKRFVRGGRIFND